MQTVSLILRRIYDFLELNVELNNILYYTHRLGHKHPLLAITHLTHIYIIELMKYHKSKNAGTSLI